MLSLDMAVTSLEKAKIATTTTATMTSSTGLTLLKNNSNNGNSGSGSGSGSNIANTIQIVETAVEFCPHMGRFWDIYERLVRSQGDHKKANHIRWRKEQQTTY